MTKTTWKAVVEQSLQGEKDFEQHWQAYQALSEEQGEQVAAWLPDQKALSNANLTSMQQALGCESYQDLYQFSLTKPECLLDYYLTARSIQFKKKPKQLLDSNDPTQACWLSGAELNIVDSCLQAPAEQLAIVESDERGVIHQLTYGELNQQVNRLSHALIQQGVVAGDAIAIIMPMDSLAVASYLAVIKLGAKVVSIADSFSSQAMAARLSLAKTRLILTQDVLLRAGKQLPLYARVCEASEVSCVVVQKGDSTLRQQDVSFDAFIEGASALSIESYAMNADETIAVLFSSGTTSTPKAIPWSTTTALKAAMDAYCYQDIKTNDRLCWPTNLGWMMGHWLIFAGLLNGACVMLYSGAPTTREFGEFVAGQKVTVLGVVPSLVRVWQQTACMESLDWSALRLFSSSGEASNAKDMLYLMFLAGYKPVIEYCGGTEIGGAYLTSTLLQANYPAVFSTPVLGCRLYLLDGNYQESESGEVFLCPPLLGLSTRLLNKDHHAIYYADLPAGPRGEVLRRHGDFMRCLPNGYYQALGRCDDSMNLGGIKTSSAELEQCLLDLPFVKEMAAVGIAPAAGGADELVIFVVPSDDSLDEATMRRQMQLAIKTQLNPLFKIAALVKLASLPKTDSNKIVRRQLKETYQREYS